MKSKQELLFDEMVAFLPQLRRFAYGLSGSLDSADELVQRTYERAFEKHQQWRRDTRLDSWLFRIMQSIHYNNYKSAKIRGADQDQIDADHLESFEGEKAMECALDLGTVHAKILQLPLDQREALLLVAVESFSYKEAASTLEIPVGTLTSRLARARMTLAKMMESSEE